MSSAPPVISRANPDRSSFRLAVIILTLIAAGLAVFVFFFNPTKYGFYPVCLFHRFTGLNCPGCGMTRALYALLHGDLLTALRDNALLVLGIPAVLARGLWLAAQKSRGRPTPNFLPDKYLWVLLFIALTFTILRNLPAFAFLSPA